MNHFVVVVRNVLQAIHNIIHVNGNVLVLFNHSMMLALYILLIHLVSIENVNLECMVLKLA